MELSARQERFQLPVLNCGDGKGAVKVLGSVALEHFRFKRIAPIV